MLLRTRTEYWWDITKIPPLTPGGTGGTSQKSPLSLQEGPGRDWRDIAKIPPLIPPAPPLTPPLTRTPLHLAWGSSPLLKSLLRRRMEYSRYSTVWCSCSPAPAPYTLRI